MSIWNVEITMNNGAIIGPFKSEGNTAEEVLLRLLEGNDYTFNSAGNEYGKLFYRVRDVSAVRIEMEK